MSATKNCPNENCEGKRRAEAFRVNDCDICHGRGWVLPPQEQKGDYQKQMGGKPAQTVNSQQG